MTTYVCMLRGIEQYIALALSLNVTAILRTKDELARVTHENPWLPRGADPGKLHVTFLEQLPDPALACAVDGYKAEPDEFRVSGREVYLHCPEGYGSTRLNNAFWERRLGVAATTRNWNTVTKLFELAGG